MDGKQVPQDLVTKVGLTFEEILKEASHFMFIILLFLVFLDYSCRGLLGFAPFKPQLWVIF